MHYLCHLLNELGEEAKIWPAKKNFRDGTLTSWIKSFRFFVRKNIFKRYITGPKFNCPVASQRDIQNSIVIYPEVISGNPLKSKSIVRWMLYFPKYDFSDINIYPNELHFSYKKNFANERSQCHEKSSLRIAWLNDSIYFRTNFKERYGTCYTARKSEIIPASEDLEDSICIDNLSHAKVAKLFNERKYLICFDKDTFFIQLAITCGCIPVVIPQKNMTKEQWRPEKAFSYGVAYGWDDIGWALETRPQRLEMIEGIRRENILNVRNFINQTQDFFVK